MARSETPEGNVSLLRALAKHLARRVRTVNLHDPNVCVSPSDPVDTWITYELPGDHFKHEVAFHVRDRRVAVRANAKYLAIDLRVELRTPFVCSFNRPDRVTCADVEVAQLATNRGAVPVFACEGEVSVALRAFLDGSGLPRALAQRPLGGDESLHVAGNGLTLYSQCASVTELMAAFEVLSDLADAIEGPEPVVALDSLPPEFAPLLSTVRQWALLDDDHRAERLERASTTARQRLVNTVSPFYPLINRYLDSFGDEPLPEAATLLGALAECAMEAAVSLENS